MTTMYSAGILVAQGYMLLRIYTTTKQNLYIWMPGVLLLSGVLGSTVGWQIMEWSYRYSRSWSIAAFVCIMIYNIYATIFIGWYTVQTPLKASQLWSTFMDNFGLYA